MLSILRSSTLLTSSVLVRSPRTNRFIFYIKSGCKQAPMKKTASLSKQITWRHQPLSISIRRWKKASPLARMKSNKLVFYVIRAIAAFSSSMWSPAAEHKNVNSYSSFLWVLIKTLRLVRVADAKNEKKEIRLSMLCCDCVTAVQTASLLLLRTKNSREQQTGGKSWSRQAQSQNAWCNSFISLLMLNKLHKNHV